MESNALNFKDKVCLVTGASTGIGRETALQFAACGAKVAISDINLDRAHETQTALKLNGADCLLISCDVSKPQEIKNLIETVMQKYGRLDCAVNNAGVEGAMAPLLDSSLENWEKVIDTNLRSVWLCMKYEIPEMIKSGGGTIVNISSIAGLIGFPGLSAYVASKHGIIGLTKTAALEYASQNIRVNAVCPGPIMTPMLERLMETEGLKEQLTKSVPQGRIGRPQEVAKSIVYLCSDFSTYVTGQSLAVDGGWVAQ